MMTDKTQPLAYLGNSDSIQAGSLSVVGGALLPSKI